jgi:pimeloyl-ACP methyl ester carboxylesterase
MNALYKSEAGEREVMALYDRTLERWPVPYETCKVGTRHGETFVIASGDRTAPPLVLLHGTCSNALAWLGDVPGYAGALRVYAVDMPGEPGRSAPERPPWDGPAYVEWLDDLFGGLGIEQTALLGLSQGGWTALKYAVARPERVTALVLLTPGGIVPARLSFVLRAIPLSLMGRPGAEALNRITFGSQPIHPDAVTFMNTIMTHFKPRIGVLPMFSDDELRCLTMPVLLLVGARDALNDSEKMAERMRRLVPAADVRVLPDAGHVLVGLVPSIMPFLAEQAGAVPA